MPTIQRDGATIHFRDEGKGLPVLLLHAFPLEGSLFEPQIEALKNRCRLIVPDHRGFGRSTLGEEPGTTKMSTIALDAVAILDRLGIAEAVVGGVSMGGYATLSMLRQAPSRIRALVLMDTQATGDDEAGKVKREETARAVLERGMDVLIETLLPRLLAPTAPHETRSWVESMIRANPPAGSAAALRGMALRGDTKDVLARFTGPSLILVGEKDVITPPEKARQMADLVAGPKKLIELPGAGHLANIEAPAAVNRAIDEFLGTLST